MRILAPVVCIATPTSSGRRNFGQDRYRFAGNSGAWGCGAGGFAWQHPLEIGGNYILSTRISQDPVVQSISKIENGSPKRTFLVKERELGWATRENMVLRSSVVSSTTGRISYEQLQASRIHRGPQPRRRAPRWSASHQVCGAGRTGDMGAGTSGRLGVLDASECPPTYGVRPGLVIGLIAGGPEALVKSREGAEDSPAQGAADLDAIGTGEADVVIGLAASGRTPYVIGGLDRAREVGALSCAISWSLRASRPRGPGTRVASHTLARQGPRGTAFGSRAEVPRRRSRR